MAKPFDIFEVAAGDRDAAAKAFKAAGGKVVGYMGATVPIELILAVGAFPLRLAELADETPLADRYMEELFDPVVRGVFEKMLAGGYDFVDAVILPRTSDSAQRLYYYLCEVGRLGEANVPIPLMYDLLHTPWSTSADYNDARTAELFQTLGALTGVAPDPDRLRVAIGLSNDRRRALHSFADLRHLDPPKVAGSHAQAVYAASQVLAPSDFIAALNAAMPMINAPQSGPRIVLAGSGQPNAALHRLIEARGGVVVGDFHDFGEPMIAPVMALDDLPLRTVSAHYHRDVFSSRTFPQSTAPLIDFAQAAGADGVLFYFLYEEEALTWEYPAQRRALDALGIPSLCFESMPQRPDEAAIGKAISGFIGNLQSKVLA